MSEAVPTLIDLLRRVGDGDHDAFASLYDQTSGILFGIVVRIVGERAAAQDVLQEAFVTIWNRSLGFDERRGGALSWMTTIARNRALDHVRRRGIHARATAHVRNDPVNPVSGPAEEASLRDERRRVRAALNDLGEAQREVVRLAYFQGLTQTQIAERVGRPLGTVKTQVRSALAALRERLRGDGS